MSYDLLKDIEWIPIPVQQADGSWLWDGIEERETSDRGVGLFLSQLLPASDCLLAIPFGGSWLSKADWTELKTDPNAIDKRWHSYAAEASNGYWDPHPRHHPNGWTGWPGGRVNEASAPDEEYNAFLAEPDLSTKQLGNKPAYPEAIQSAANPLFVLLMREDGGCKGEQIFMHYDRDICGEEYTPNDPSTPRIFHRSPLRDLTRCASLRSARPSSQTQLEDAHIERGSEVKKDVLIERARVMRLTDEKAKQFKRQRIAVSNLSRDGGGRFGPARSFG
jgi:hypothetical protein